MEDSVKVRVKNRDHGVVAYVVPDMGNLERRYEPGEEKIVTFEELRKLSYTSGGKFLIENYLIIQEREVLEELGIFTEPEYFYTDQEIKRLMTTGTLDEFLDCLDFAPEGVLESIKNLAVELPLNDVAKRQAIMDKTGFSVTNAIAMKETSEEEEIGAKTTGRRAAVPSEKQSSPKPDSTGRRVQTD